MANTTAKKVEEVVRPHVEKADAWLLEVVLRRDHGAQIVEIVVDTETGVTTNECAAISREISKALDAADLIAGKYYLTVASPGTDRPMTFPAQYRKHVGRTLRLERTADAGGGTVEGVLVSASEKELVLDTGEENPATVPFASIATGIVVTPW